MTYVIVRMSMSIEIRLSPMMMKIAVETFMKSNESNNMLLLNRKFCGKRCSGFRVQGFRVYGFRFRGSGVEMLITCTIAKLGSILIDACMHDLDQNRS